MNNYEILNIVRGILHLIQNAITNITTLATILP